MLFLYGSLLVCLDEEKRTKGCGKMWSDEYDLCVGVRRREREGGRETFSLPSFCVFESGILCVEIFLVFFL